MCQPWSKYSPTLNDPGFCDMFRNKGSFEELAVMTLQVA